MAQLKVIVQSLARLHHAPKEFLMAVNQVVADNIDGKSFITMSYGVIDLERREMTFARAGHCPLIHVPGSAAGRPAQGARSCAPDGLVVGLKIDDGEMFDSMLRRDDPAGAGRPDRLLHRRHQRDDERGVRLLRRARLAKVLEQYAHLPFEQLRSFIFADLRASPAAPISTTT